jgi:hypothetical protein
VHANLFDEEPQQLLCLLGALGRQDLFRDALLPAGGSLPGGYFSRTPRMIFACT